MKTGKITAKLRDAVKIHIVEEGHPECSRIYKNIELPDMLKDIDYKDFEFLIMGEKIEFEITYEKGSLPSKLPTERPKITREEKCAAKVLEEARKSQNKALPPCDSRYPGHARQEACGSGGIPGPKRRQAHHPCHDQGGNQGGFQARHQAGKQARSAQG